MGLTDKWTEAEENIANLLITARADNATFLAKTGHTKQAAYSHRCYVRNGRPRRERYRQAIAEGKVGGADVKSVARPTEEMLLDARQRAQAPRSLTAWLSGDPPPGQSALDKKHAESNSS
jgi:hypothetical protein